MVKRGVFFALVLVFAIWKSSLLPAQGIWGYWNAGSLPARTLELGLAIHPKNEDWLTIHTGLGYTLNGGYYFPKKTDCNTELKNGGTFIRLGARNSLTSDHHEDHLFWGIDALFIGYRESAIDRCDADEPGKAVESKGKAFGGLLEAGYAWNISKRSHTSRVFLDLGIRAGAPLYNSAPFLGSLNYLPGIGFGKSGSRGFNIAPVARFRVELWHGRYGHYKIGKV